MWPWTAIAQLAAITLVARWLYLLMEWQGNRITRQMVSDVQAVLRSRTPGGSDLNPPGASTPSGASGATGPGVEACPARTSPPPAPAKPAPSSANTWRNQSSVGGAVPRTVPPTGPSPSGDR